MSLDSWKTELETSNIAFDTYYVERSIQTGTSGSDKVYNKRPGTNSAYFELRDQLNAWYIIKKKAEPLSTVINALNGVIGDYNDLINNRGAADTENPAPPTNLPA